MNGSEEDLGVAISMCTIETAKKARKAKKAKKVHKARKTLV